MEARVLAIFAIAIAILVSGVRSTTITIKNQCRYTIYPAFLTGSGTQLQTTGFELASQAAKQVNIGAPWSGRIWARFLCSQRGGQFSCLSGDCGTGQISCNQRGGAPPATLVEFTLAGDGGKDFYDVSLVDGFNLPVRVQPQSGRSCKVAECPININARCQLPGLAIRNPSAGGIIGCKSACLAFNKPMFCCTGDFGSPGKCKPTMYSNFFKKNCPYAYSYAYDDGSSLFTCPTGANYLVTFCS